MVRRQPHRGAVCRRQREYVGTPQAGVLAGAAAGAGAALIVWPATRLARRHGNPLPAAVGADRVRFLRLRGPAGDALLLRPTSACLSFRSLQASRSATCCSTDPPEREFE